MRGPFCPCGVCRIPFFYRSVVGGPGNFHGESSKNREGGRRDNVAENGCGLHFSR